VNGFGEIQLFVSSGNNTGNPGLTANTTTFPTVPYGSHGSAVYAGLTVEADLTSYVTDTNPNSTYYDIFDVIITGLTSANASLGLLPSMIKIGAYMNQDNNTNNVNGLQISSQSFNYTGINVTNPRAGTMPPAYQTGGELVAAALDYALPESFGIPSMAVSAAFYEYNQHVESYDSSLSSSSTVYGTSQFYQTYKINQSSYAALAQTGIQWAIPYNEIDNNQTFVLTVFASCNQPYYGYWNTSLLDIFVTEENSNNGGGTGGGCVAFGSSILTPNGYVPVQHLKAGDKIEEYDFSNDSLVTGTVLYNNRTEVNQIVSINNGTLLLTPTEQPIYIKNSSFTGWLRNPENLTNRDQIFDPLNNSWTLVTSVQILNEHMTVFDVVTSGFNNFIDNGYLLDIKLG
jgi:hypothetical protein